MKAIGYLIAGAALLPELAAGLNATANDAIWKYQGCYSDKSYTDATANGVAVRGVPYFPRTLNGLFVRNATNSGKSCRDYCLNNLFPVAATNNDQCWCDTSIGRNGTSATAPTYGIRDPDDSNCQQPCPGNPGEACGNSTANAPVQRLTVYQMVSGFYQCCVVLFGFCLGLWLCAFALAFVAGFGLDMGVELGLDWSRIWYWSWNWIRIWGWGWDLLRFMACMQIWCKRWLRRRSMVTLERGTYGQVSERVEIRVGRRNSVKSYLRMGMYGQGLDRVAIMLGRQTAAKIYLGMGKDG